MKWFVGSALLLLAALILQSGLLAYSMYVLLGILVLSRLLAWAWVHQLTAQRQCKTMTLEVGQTIAVEVKVKNGSFLPVPWVLMEDVLPAKNYVERRLRLRVKKKRTKLASLASLGETTLEYKIKFRMRGYYQIGPLVLETGDLFGLQRRYRVGSEPQFVLVYPRVISLLGYELASRRPMGEMRLSHRLFEDPTRIVGVRSYEVGDPLNRVHWRTTARMGTLYSKVLEPSTIAGATLVLDFHQAGYDAAREPQRSDLAITTAASVAHALYQMNQQVGFISNGRDAADRILRRGWEHDFRTRKAALHNALGEKPQDRLQPVMVETRRGVEQFQRIREVLARVELNDGLTFPQLIVETTSRLPRNATVIALLSQAGPETAIALGNLRRRGYAVLAVLMLFSEAEELRARNQLEIEGIESVRVHKENDVARLCRRFLLR